MPRSVALHGVIAPCSVVPEFSVLYYVRLASARQKDKCHCRVGRDRSCAVFTDSQSIVYTQYPGRLPHASRPAASAVARCLPPVGAVPGLSSRARNCRLASPTSRWVASAGPRAGYQTSSHSGRWSACPLSPRRGCRTGIPPFRRLSAVLCQEPGFLDLCVGRPGSSYSRRDGDFRHHGWFGHGVQSGRYKQWPARVR